MEISHRTLNTDIFFMTENKNKNLVLFELTYNFSNDYNSSGNKNFKCVLHRFINFWLKSYLYEFVEFDQSLSFV